MTKPACGPGLWPSRSFHLIAAATGRYLQHLRGKVYATVTGVTHDSITDLRSLTDREREVLSLLANGPSNRAMARQLGITERTVKAHLTNLMRKLGIESRLEAALISNLHGDEIRNNGDHP